MYGSPKISTFIKQKIPTWGQGGTELVKKIVKVLCEPKILKIGGNTLQTGCLECRMFTQNLFQPIMHQYSYIFIFIVVFYLDRNQGQEKKKEKKLRIYFRITSFSLRTFFVYHIGKFFDGSISKCLPMYLFRIESSLGMFIIVQYFNLTFYSDDQRTFPCGRLEITKGTN